MTNKFKIGDRIIRKTVRFDGAKANSAGIIDVPNGTPAVILEIHGTDPEDIRYMVRLPNGFNGHWWREINCQPEIDEKQLAKDLEEARKDMASWFTPH